MKGVGLHWVRGFGFQAYDFKYHLKSVGFSVKGLKFFGLGFRVSPEGRWIYGFRCRVSLDLGFRGFGDTGKP